MNEEGNLMEQIVKGLLSWASILEEKDIRYRDLTSKLGGDTSRYADKLARLDLMESLLPEAD